MHYFVSVDLAKGPRYEALIDIYQLVKSLFTGHTAT